KLTLNGLTGGHSGMDIHRGRGNANKLMNRTLSMASEVFSLSISEIDGGGLRNAIPRESTAIIGVSELEKNEFEQWIKEFEKTLKSEYHTTDPNLKLSIESHTRPMKVLQADFQTEILQAIYATPVGIYRMSPEIEGLVQTSNNVARVLVKEGEYSVLCLTRSSVDSEKMDEAQAIKSVFSLIGATVEFSGTYPGWTPKPDAQIVSIMRDLYRKKFNSEPHVMACHAGLECGILGTNYPEMEMISFGPNIRGAHSPDECAQISSVQKFWSFLLDALKEIPKA
ncbi:MAG: M20/M25/M40 family metallo-hydrolase, partial [Salibacteraceae bacterium]